MNKIIFISLNLILLNCNSVVSEDKVASNSVANYLNIDTLVFDSLNYELIWSSHPQQQYYKHEFLVKGDSIKHFKQMISIDMLIGNYELLNLVNQKRVELEKRKATDVICNHVLYENGENGEYMLDFLISNNDSNSIMVERNIYRYKSYSDSLNKGVLLFSYSERAYDNEILNFMKSLKGNNINMINEIGNFDLSKVKLVSNLK